jgi:hypothetical protein
MDFFLIFGYSDGYGKRITKTKKEGKFYADFEFHGKASNAILSQIRLFDAKRLRYKIGKMSAGDYLKIKEKLIELLQ